MMCLFFVSNSQCWAVAGFVERMVFSRAALCLAPLPLDFQDALKSARH